MFRLVLGLLWDMGRRRGFVAPFLFLGRWDGEDFFLSGL